MAFPFAAPTTALGHLRILSPTAGVKVSPLALGTWSLGSAWQSFAGGGATADEAFVYLDAYRDAGGNFIDTANMYQNGQAEQIVGDWMEARECRDEIVLAAKYSYCFHPQAAYTRGQGNFQGNNAKSLYTSFESSLKRLKADYIDILYVHFWDYTTSIPEVMNALDSLVRARKVLYLGISDTPAWIVAKANEYARANRLTPFVIYQGQWSLLKRDLESEILPMLQAEGMALAPYGVAGSGKFKSAAELAARDAAGSWRYGVSPTAEEHAISRILEEVGTELPGRPGPIAVAQTWAMSKVPYVFPLVGGTSPEHLKANIEALKLSLSPAQIERIEAVKPFTPLFPMDTFGTNPAFSSSGLQSSPYAMMPHIEFVRAPKPLGPSATAE